MSNSTKKKFELSVLIKKDGDEFVAHCLEFDIVAAADTLKEVKEDIISLICAHIEYALSNDNYDYLCYSAPAEVWEEFKKCKAGKSEIYPENPYFNAEMCEANNLTACHA